MKPTLQQQEAFLSGGALPGVAFGLNAPVMVTRGEQSGSVGSIVSIEELGRDPLYLVELSSGQEALVCQSLLRPLE